MKLTAEPGRQLPAAERRARVLELGVYLLLIVPPMVLQWFAGSPTGPGLPVRVVGTLVTDCALVALALYFNWRSGEPLARVGWSSAGLGREILIGMGLFVPFALAVAGIGWLLQAVGLPTGGAPAVPAIHGTLQIAAVALFVVIIAVSEETIFRGYLLLRLTELTGSKAFAVVLSALIFSLGHQYEGTAGMITVGGMGAMFALVYLWRGSLAAPMVLHFLQDFIALTAGGHGR